MESQSEQFEWETEETRWRLAGTLEELRDRMTPGRVFDQVVDYTRDGPAADFLRNQREIIAGFHEFLTFGGLPELFTISDNDAKLSYLSGILSKVILDDVVRRFRVDNVTLLEKVFQYLFFDLSGCVP